MDLRQHLQKKSKMRRMYISSGSDIDFLPIDFLHREKGENSKTINKETQMIKESQYNLNEMKENQRKRRREWSTNLNKRNVHSKEEKPKYIRIKNKEKSPLSLLYEQNMKKTQEDVSHPLSSMSKPINTGYIDSIINNTKYCNSYGEKYRRSISEDKRQSTKFPSKKSTNSLFMKSFISKLSSQCNSNAHLLSKNKEENNIEGKDSMNWDCNYSETFNSTDSAQDLPIESVRKQKLIIELESLSSSINSHILDYQNTSLLSSSTYEQSLKNFEENLIILQRKWRKDKFNKILKSSSISHYNCSLKLEISNIVINFQEKINKLNTFLNQNT